MSGVQLHARISFKAPSNWKLSFFSRLCMKPSGDSTQHFFSGKYFLCQSKLMQEIEINTVEIRFCLFVLSILVVFIHSSWSMMKLPVCFIEEDFFSRRSKPVLLLLKQLKIQQGNRYSCQKLNQATHCIKKLSCQFQTAERILPDGIFYPIKDRCTFFSCLTRWIQQEVRKIQLR